MKFERVSVGPYRARILLGRNTHNRAARPSVVSTYANDMSKGNWQENGDTIKISRSEVLLDGQHRLLAIIESGATVNLLIVSELPDQTQETMDAGIKRKFSDVLYLRKEKDYKNLASAVRGVYNHQRRKRTFSGGLTLTASNAELSDLLDEYPWLRAGLSLIRSMVSLGMPGAVASAFWWATQQIDSEDSDYFCAHLVSDLGHEPDSPIYQLRRVLQNSRNDQVTMNRSVLAALTFKAWNKFRNGEKCGQLRFRAGGSNPEKFPELI